MDKTSNRFLFIGGDISGIQKFIYNITSKKAAVSLKGRSAYLVQYTESLCDRLSKLPSMKFAQFCEVIYCSGGKFYMLASDSTDIRSEIDRFASDAEDELWAKQQGQLGIAIGYVPFEVNDFKDIKSISKVVIETGTYPIGELWARMATIFAKKKYHKFHNMLTRHYADLFEVIPVNSGTKVCAVTGLESEECVLIKPDQESGGIWVLPSVKEQIDLGKSIRATEHFKTFEEYAQDSYLGILRMDVDFLGRRFIKGFNSFQEYTTFSSRLRKFFEEEVRNIQHNDVFSEDVNIIYAGGDDLFAVGRWDKIIDFAEEIHNHFNSSFGKDGLSISGGITITGPKYPIAKSAELSGIAESSAKEYKGGIKNAICFLGECVNWGTEFNYVKDLKDEFVHHIEEEGLPRGILQKIILYGSLAQKGDDLSYQWHEVYYLTRMLDRLDKSHEATISFVHRLRDVELVKGKENFRLVALAARWAELMTK